jgi:putative DNA primase/helicase
LTYDVSQQKFFLFEGTGANGKGVVTYILMMLLGMPNVSSIPLELFADTHGLEVTLGKLVNIVSEIGELDRVAEGKLNPKYKHPYSAIPTAKLIISTNVRPPFRDRSEGVWRRLVLLPFPVTIPESKQKKHLAEDLIAELPGIFNWAVEGHAILMKRGYFVEPVVCREAKKDFREESISASNTQTLRTCLYSEYETFCKNHGFKALNDANFGKEVRRVFPEVQRVKLSGSSHSHRPYIYKGLRLLKSQT